MKTKLFGFLLLFFAVSLVAWSYSPGDVRETSSNPPEAWSFEVPSCAGRDAGGAGATTSHPGKTGALTPSENPLHSAFMEVNCLLASN